MKTVELGRTGTSVPNVSLGCMRMNALSPSEAAQIIETSIEVGINFFDHADIYGGGDSETTFAQALKETSVSREDLILQSKVGIRKGYYDFSKEHILEGVESILKRLDTDYLDVLLLHRPDALVEPEEVAEAFDTLHSSGKVKHFGVSNHSPLQIELLKKYINQELVANQLQMSVTHTGMIDAGINVNRTESGSIDHDGGILDYSRLHDITVQPWAPVQAPGRGGVIFTDPESKEVSDKLSELGEKYGLNNEAMAIAWLLRHPAKIQVILGTMNAERIKNYASASEIEISRPDWYEIYKSAGKLIP